MSTLLKPRLTPEEYLEMEDVTEFKSEFYRGEMVAMPGATYNHNLIAGNVVRYLGNQLLGRPGSTCGSDMRVHVPRTGLYTYANALVICGEPRFPDQKQMTLLNPTAIVEVLAASTEAYDRGRKLEHYQSIESLRECLLVASDRMSASLYRRQSQFEWLLITANTAESIVELDSAGCRLTLRDLYDRVELPPERLIAPPL